MKDNFDRRAYMSNICKELIDLLYEVEDKYLSQCEGFDEYNTVCDLFTGVRGVLRAVGKINR